MSKKKPFKNLSHFIFIWYILKNKIPKQTETQIRHSFKKLKHTKIKPVVSIQQKIYFSNQTAKREKMCKIFEGRPLLSPYIILIQRNNFTRDWNWNHQQNVSI